MDHVRPAWMVMVALGALAGTAGAKDKAKTSEEVVPDAKAEEVKAVRDAGVVISDGKGHYIAFASPDPGRSSPGTERAVFYGDGTTFYRLFIKSYATDSTPTEVRADWGIVDERLGFELDRSSLRVRGPAFTMTCRDEQSKTSLTPLPPAEARALLAKAAFKANRMDRAGYALGRDGTTYYYVDVSSRSEASTDFRAYVGKRGAMTLLKLTDTTADTKGVVLTSKTGTLRVTTKPPALAWAPKPNKQVELDAIPIEKNLELVYSELGVYAGKKFGVPCDDM